MSISEQTCNCGTGTTAEAGTAPAASEPCTCGCCGAQPASSSPSKDEQIADLLHQRDLVDQRLAELQST